MDTVEKVLMGIYFYPRGGSAHSARALARQLEVQGLEVTLLSGSRTDLGPIADAAAFYDGLDVRSVDFTPALASAQPLDYVGPACTAPIHGSFENRLDAPDAVLTSLDADQLELQVEAWSRRLEAAAAGGVDRLYLHHLTPLNEVAARVLPDVPIIGHIHGTELLMLEEIEQGPPAAWEHAQEWAARLRHWAAQCRRIVVNDRGGLTRAAALLDLEEDRFACIPNGFDTTFVPGEVDRRAHWHRHLVECPRGWLPGGAPGSVAYRDQDLEALDGTVLLAVGRFTEVKRLPLLIEAFAEAQTAFDERAALVLIGGYPGEWEGEHPAEAIARSGARDVFLAGWHGHGELPQLLQAGDLLVHASVREQFGQVLVEAMACGLPVIAVDAHGPAGIVDDGETGWLVPPDDEDAMVEAMVELVTGDDERRRRGEAAYRESREHYSWPALVENLARVYDEVRAGRRPGRGLSSLS
jgi:glycosyltransferase involved in cell wall biosynthesis